MRTNHGNLPYAEIIELLHQTMSTLSFDYTCCSERNRSYATNIIEVAGGVRFAVLSMSDAEVASSRTLIYIHVNRHNKKFYIGRTTMKAEDRFHRGYGYRLQKAMSAAIRRYGWESFYTYVLALGDDDTSLCALERQAIKDAGGHKNHNSYNMSPGGEFVADNCKPILCVHMPTMTQTEYESAIACGVALGIYPDGVSAVARGDMNSRKSARRQNIGDYYFYFKGEFPRYPDKWGKRARNQRIADKIGRAIIAINYNDQTDRRRFRSSGEAAQELGLNQSAVSQVVLKNAHSAGEWFFYPEDDPCEIPMARGSAATRAIRDIVVIAVNLKTGERKSYRNATVAGRAVGISQSSVSTVLSGKRNSENGFWFTYDPIAEPPTHFGKSSVRFHMEQPVMAIEVRTGNKTPFPSAGSVPVSSCGVMQGLEEVLGS